MKRELLIRRGTQMAVVELSELDFLNLAQFLEQVPCSKLVIDIPCGRQFGSGSEVMEHYVSGYDQDVDESMSGGEW
jgi:hypothetical protein